MTYLQSDKKSKIDLSNYVKGVYNVDVILDGKKFSEQVVVN